MKPIHLAVAGAVLAVLAVLYFMRDDTAERQGARSNVTHTDRSRTDAGAEDQGKDAGSAGQQEGDLAVTVRVLGPDGEPASGASLQLVGLRTRDAATDREGAGGFEGLAAGYYTLLARQGNAIGSKNFLLAKTTDLGTLRLAESVAIRGHVFDPHGEPIVGARVEAVRNDMAGGLDFTKIIELWITPDPVTASVGTKADGAYELRVRKGGSFALRVSATGFAQEGEPARVYAADTDPVDFYLFHGTTVAGVVVDPDGKPIPAARVMVSNPMAMFSRRMPKSETTTGSDGTFSMAVIPAQQLMLGVRAAGFALYMNTLKLPATDQRITLEPGVQLRLKAIDAAQPVPAPGVLVLVNYRGGFASGETDERGELIIQHLPTKQQGAMGRQQQLFFMGGGFVPKMVTLTEKKEAVDGVLDLGSVELTRGGIIRGRALDSRSGDPVPGAKVRSFGGLEMQLQFLGSIPVTTNEKGEFELTGVPLGATMLIGQHPDYVSDFNPMGMAMGRVVGKKLFLEGEIEIERDVKLTAAAVVKGLVQDGAGEPVAGALVKVQLGQEAMFMQLMGSGIPEAITDAEGAFQLGGLKDGNAVKLIATHREFGGSKTLSVTPGSGEPVVLVLADPIQVTGKVVDEAGDPVAGVRVSIDRKSQAKGRRSFNPMSQEGTARPAISDEKGMFLVRNAPTGDLVARFEHEAYRPGRTELRTLAGTATHTMETVTLTRGPGIGGVVVDTDGKPVANVTVNVTTANFNQQSNDEGRQFANAQTDKDGRFQVFGLKQAEYTVQPYQAGSYGEKKTAAAGTKDMRLALSPAAELKGRVTANGKPVSGATIRAQRAGSGDTNQAMRDYLGWAQTDADGAFTMTPLPPGESFRVVIQHNAYANKTIENVSAGGPARAFQLDAGVQVGGVVVDEKGNPVPNAQLMVKVAGESKWVQADTDGHWIAGGLGNGDITIEVGTWSGFIGGEPQAVTPGDLNVRVVVERGETISGTVVGGDDKQQVRVEALDADASSKSQAWIVGGSRTFALRGLRPGRYTIRAQRYADGKWTTIAEIPDVATGTSNVELSVD